MPRYVRAEWPSARLRFHFEDRSDLVAIPTSLLQAWKTMVQNNKRKLAVYQKDRAAPGRKGTIAVLGALQGDLAAILRVARAGDRVAGAA